MEDSKHKWAQINVYQEYHEKIVEIWKIVEKNDYFIEKEIYKKAFVQDTLNKNGILFLGVGASLAAGFEDTCETKDDLVQYETIKGREKWPYYKKMGKIAEYAGFEDNWSNIDITLFRETKQEILQPFFKKTPNIMSMQLELAKKMIIAAEPIIIIASNTLVRDVLQNNRDQSNVESGFADEFSEEYGTPIIKSPDKLEGKPIFYTSMLSGQRALDNGSYERLKWHIKHVKELLGH